MSPAGRGRSRTPPVVLLAYHYPPNREVGALRSAKVAAALTAAGHAVTVVRSGSDEEPSTMRPSPLLRVDTVVPLPSPREWYASVRRAFRAPTTHDGNGDATRSGDDWTPPREVSAFKRFAFSLFWLPDDHQGFIWPAAKATANALGRAGPDAILYSTSPPHSVHVAALLAQVWTRARWVFELRDPWTGNPGKPWYSRSRLTDTIENWLEHECLRRARAVVGVSQGICDLVADHIDRRCTELILARNGIDHLLEPATPRRASGPIRIVHAGTLYLGRDPRPFLRALGAVIRQHGLGPDDVRVDLIGKSDMFAGMSVQDMIHQEGLGSVVHLEPWLPHDEVQQRLRSADALLLLAEGQPRQVPNKLYEYLGTRRPMLVFADPEGETATMVRAVGGHWVVDRHDPERAEAAIAEAVSGAAPPGSANPTLLETWTTERQIAGVVEAVGAATA